MREIPIELSLEQEFSLKTYEQQVQGLNDKQAQGLLLEVLRQLMMKENVIKHLITQIK